MFEYLSGKLNHIYPTYLVLEVGGIGYKLHVANPFRFQGQLSTTTTLYVEQVVREDSNTLYGFKDLEEKNLFLTLNKVSGIGPKSALSILAADDHQGLIGAIEVGDSNYLTKFPGVGKKTAQQMVLDLKGQLAEVLSSDKGQDQPEVSIDRDVNHLQEIQQALEGLGYSAREIKRIEKPLKDAKVQSTQEGLSLAFKLLLK